ncbi:hypothetical protein ACLB2K_035255 [Fragaria x ananassa]
MDDVLGKEVRDVEGLGPIPVDSLRNKSIYLGYLRERFQTVSPDEDLENYVNAYVLYVVGTVILADSGVEVCIGYLACIKGGAFRDYAWGAALLSHFHFYFQKKNQKHIGGCMVALMVYLFEHFPSLRDEFFRDKDGLPKFLPYTLPSVYPLCAGWAAHIKDVLQNRRNRSPVDYEALTSENNEVIWNPYERLPDNFFPESIRVDRQMRLYRGPLVHPIHNRVIIYHRPDCCPRHFGVQRVIADHCPPVNGYVKSTSAPSLKKISKLIGAYKSWQQSLVELPIDDDNDSSVVENVLQPSGLKGLNGQLELYNVDEQEPTATQEHFMTTDIEWDPTGR